MKIACLICALMITTLTLYGQKKMNREEKDTAYVAGSQSLNPDFFENYLEFKSKGKKKIVFSGIAADSLHKVLSFSFDYKSDSLYYKCFSLDYGPDEHWNLFWNRRNNWFYITKPYDGGEGIDGIIKESVDFNKMRMQVFTNSGIEKTLMLQTVALARVWPQNEKKFTKAEMERIMKSFKQNKDTTYIQGIHYKTFGDTGFQLILKSNGKRNVVYTKKVTDGADVDLSFAFNYNDDSLNYTCFDLYDGVAGSLKSILWNKESNYFYITDKYNLSAGDDSIIRKSVHFRNKMVAICGDSVISNEYSSADKRISYTYKIKLNQIWPKKKNNIQPGTNAIRTKQLYRH